MTKHLFEDQITKRRVEIIESINDIPSALKEKDYIRVRILLNRSKELLEKIVDIASIPTHKVAVINLNPPKLDDVEDAKTQKSRRPRKEAREPFT